MLKNRANYLLLLLTLAALLWLAGDSLKIMPTPISPSHPKQTDSNQSHIDHNDPVNNMRMGFFQYNEGNKALKEGKWEEAVQNYKMALHHNPNGTETLINLSTTYLRSKQYDEAYKTLKTLEEKAPANPLLFYNFACYYALTNQIDSSLNALKQAVALGYKNLKEIKEDPDLESLRKTPGFIEWLNTID